MDHFAPVYYERGCEVRAPAEKVETGFAQIRRDNQRIYSIGRSGFIARLCRYGLGRRREIRCGYTKRLIPQSNTYLRLLIKGVAMALNYFPKLGSVYVCDFSDFKAPEMTKKRPVIILSRKIPYRSEIVIVVPISLTEPRKEYPFVVHLSQNYHPNEPDDLPCWAKCDMVMNLAKRRLSAFKVGRRKYVYPTLSQTDLEAVQIGVIYGLGLHHLINTPN